MTEGKGLGEDAWKVILTFLDGCDELGMSAEQAALVAAYTSGYVLRRTYAGNRETLEVYAVEMARSLLESADSQLEPAIAPRGIGP